MQNSERGSAVVTHRPLWRKGLALPAFCILHSALLLALVGCGAKAKAQTLPDGPPLAVPTAPPHEIVIEQVAEAPPQEPAPEPVVEQPTAQPTAPRQQRQPTTRTETPPPNQPAVTPPAPEPPVRAAPAAAAGDEKKAQQLIAKATDDLTKRIDYQKLSAQGKEQYEQSKRFRDQAEQALKEKNVLLAVTLAEKAANMASELVR